MIKDVNCQVHNILRPVRFKLSTNLKMNVISNFQEENHGLKRSMKILFCPESVTIVLAFLSGNFLESGKK